MPDPFLRLSRNEQRDALELAASRLERPAHLLEKDIWVVWALHALFGAPFGAHLVFKGGTSLSKAFNATRRFSEDVDLTYDIRAIAPDLIGESGNPLPPSRSQAAKWTKEVRKRLPGWIDETVIPHLKHHLGADGLDASVARDEDTVLIDYAPVSTGTGYVRPAVLVEFGARSTGEPADQRDIACDAASVVDGVLFPTAMPRVMHAERTFWEKATAIHVYCKRGEFRGAERYARHWYDLSCLDEAEIATAALKDRPLAEAVAAHKTAFFAEKDRDGNPIDYHAAVNGGLCLVPDGEPLEALRQDYAAMLDDGLLFDDPQSFEKLMEQCASLQRRANA